VEFFAADGTTIDTTGIVVETVGFTDPTQIWALVNVAADAVLAARRIRVTNPDGGMAESAVAVVDLSDPQPGDTVGLGAPPSKTSTTTATTAPTISSLAPSSAILGRSIAINGSGFSTTLSENSVSFTGANSTKVAVTPTTASGSQLAVTVPLQAIDGPVTVAVNGVVSNAVTFTATSPRLTAVIPASGEQGTTVSLQLTGSKFVTGAAVSFTAGGLPVSGIAVGSATSVSSDGTSITASITIDPATALGFVDVTVTNPRDANGDVGTSTLLSGFEVRRPSVVQVTLPAFTNVAAYLPSVGAVSVTRDSNGRCTAKSITPAAVQVRASYTTLPATLPARLRFTIQSSALAGTASNEDCELGTTAAPDFTVGAADGSTQTVLADGGGDGTYTTTLYSYDWGGTVRVVVSDPTTGQELGRLSLPSDIDNDGLPDAYEDDKTLNRANADENGNGIIDDNDKFARDGLTNFEKYRGVYLQGPAAGGSGSMASHTRLDPRLRHYFVRARGFGNDPLVRASSGTCGVDTSVEPAVPVPDATLSATNPCPNFEVGDAFTGYGIRVVDVTAYFTTGMELPRKSMMDPTRATLDLATIVYDGVNCSGAQNCDLTSKTGTRQWEFPTLGFSTFGSSSAYGEAFVFKRAVDAYFANKPYEHRTNDPTRVVTAPDGRPMLAPITLVGDANDNGVTDRREATVNGELAGDTYITGNFAKHLSALDANNDGCVELPLVPDPTSTPDACSPAGSSATGPQATRQQVVRHVTTHELGHAAGVSLHTTDTVDLMYQYSINWTRDGHFSATAGALLQIHNKGLQ
jgi:hypothetical protein